MSGASASTAASGGVAAAAGPTSADKTAPRPATKAQWAKIVAAAKREGQVTLYSSGNPVNLAAMGERFKAKYGITLTVNRQLDNVLAQQVTSEYGSDNVKVDVLVNATKAIVLGAQKPQNRWAVDAVGPALFAKGYNRKIFARPAKAVVVGAAVLGLAWNTNQYPQGVRVLPDVLDPRLKGRLGIIIPGAYSIIDWYKWIEENWGKSLITKLAAQDPKLYPSSLPMTQAVASGEIAVGAFTVPTALDLKAQGAPIDWRVHKGPKTGIWAAPWYAMVMRKAPHPNAAQVLLNYMLTAEGAALAHKYIGVPLKNVPNTIYFTPREQNLKESTPAKVAEFQKYWDGLFRK